MSDLPKKLNRFITGQNVIEIKDKRDFDLFVKTLETTKMDEILNNKDYSYWSEILHIHKKEKDYELCKEDYIWFEYQPGKGLSLYFNPKEPTEWYGAEPLRFDEKDYEILISQEKRENDYSNEIEEEEKNLKKINDSYVYGEYALTPCKNVWNNKTSYWISKKDCMISQYAFTPISTRELNDKSIIETFEAFIPILEKRMAPTEDIKKEMEVEETEEEEEDEIER